MSKDAARIKETTTGGKGMKAKEWEQKNSKRARNTKKEEKARKAQKRVK